jgi:hypothetical protein
VLTIAQDATAFEFLDNLALIHTNSTALGFGLQRTFSVATNTATGCDIGIDSESLFLSGSHLAVTNNLGIVHAPVGKPKAIHALGDGFSIDACSLADCENGFAGDVGSVHINSDSVMFCPPPLFEVEAMLSHNTRKSGLTNPGAFGDLLERFAGFASFDEVVNVITAEYDGHVYDLQEVSGLMYANSITASNCYCGVTECLLDSEGRPILTDALKKRMGDALAKWQKANP